MATNTTFSNISEPGVVFDAESIDLDPFCPEYGTSGHLLVRISFYYIE